MRLFALTAALATAAFAEGAHPPGVEYDAKGCSACHAALTQRKAVHSVFNGGGCAQCHKPSATPGKCAKGGWELLEPGADLCARCHDMTGKAPMHPVIAVLGCTACHDPHASDNPKQLKRWPLDALCYGCHDRKDQKPFVHTAVKKAECLGCHDPHAGKAAPLLRKPREQLCLSCHKAADLTPAPVQHQPVLEGRCLECHDPHQSKNEKQLVKAGKALCLKCHDAALPEKPGLPRPGKRIDLAKKNVHQAIVQGNCQDCHEQKHSSENLKLLARVPPDTCYKCHDRKDDKKFTHGAVKQGDCAVCHSPHSSDLNNLLTEATPAALCFRCHEDDVTGRAFVHKPVAEGKCTDCHHPHGAKNRFNLKTGSGAAACTKCHKGKGEAKVRHKALEYYGCTACHDPHASGNASQLIKPVNQLCQTCHKDKTDGMHASTFVAGGHAISGDFDPRRPGRSFSCASCHDPHGSDNPRFFRFGKDKFEMCDGCHGDRTGAHPELKDIHRKPVAQVQR